MADDPNLAPDNDHDAALGFVEPRPLPFDGLVISDLHLGSDMCQARMLESFLEWAVKNSRELIINGDIFDDLNFKRLTKRHFACLKVIRRNSDRDDFRLIWVRGNHDGPADIVSHIVGVDILDEYAYDNGRVQLLILHGDQFDTFITRYKLLTDVACGIFYWIQKWAPHRTARWIRRVTKKWQRNSQLVQQRAVDYARGKGYRFVTCGHTHLPLTAEVDGIRYLNSGTWIEHPPNPFVAVRGDRVELLTWPLEGVDVTPAEADGEGEGVEAAHRPEPSRVAMRPGIGGRAVD